MDFSIVVKNSLESRGISVAHFAEKMEFSDKYIYDLLRRRNKRRWNEDSINKACDVLGLKIEIK